MGRKYWIGSSDEEDHKPTDYETHIVENTTDLEEAIAQMNHYVEDDYEIEMGDLENE